MKVILDTNIIISYLLQNEIAIEVINFLIENKSILYIDDRLLHEYKIIPKRRKFDFSEMQLLDLEQFINNNFQKIETGSNKITFNPDRQDSKLIEIANSSNSDYIISNDKPILKNAQHLSKAKIISLIDFHQQYIAK